ncbi:MAG: alanine--tRNA ligase [Candidatus Omnitrophica bacterium]|nr:alanine--tRNA ligase [Candidatus Omnitrophota bacterium]MBU4479615.1 alanine--tRNA ligase [Candidatus Omnitrophota bacterium]MCG2704029.1 alanine--tRNA ligase [Candidatus Omnitrophota bacterium]
MKANRIRAGFLEFFKSKGHNIVSSDSLVPQNDPSVLFTSAGMNQFKEQFMGRITGFRRAASSQKCLRTADLANVGISPTHHTFFEMLGNFSFGDYFKKEAISWAWEFVTDVLKLPPERLWISVHKDDAQAYDIWLNTIKIQPEHIVKLGDKDNFWPANAPQDGPNGPCGPCSEIFYDWTEKVGCGRADCSPVCDCRRFTEIWNLVFTQYDRRPDASLSALPSKNIDTGMGLERITAVMQDVRDNYATDLFVPILDTLKEQLSRGGISACAEWFDTRAKAISDHIRAAVFSIADGVVPSNETRGYVIRKLIRRAIVNLKHAGIDKPFLYTLVHAVAKTMEEPYPELLRRHETIAGIIKKEEEMFWTILKERAPQNDASFRELAQNSASAELPCKVIVETTGISAGSANAFIQYDTYGVPLEISKENALKYGLVVVDDQVEKAMEIQRQRSRSKSRIAGEIFTKGTAELLQGISSDFIGYERLEENSAVTAIIKSDMLVEQVSAGDEADIIPAVTPFYAESGGQTGDTGILRNDAGFEAEVIDTRKVDKAILHKAKVKHGTLRKNDMVTLCVNQQTRLATARNHTATHLLQYALRTILGEHVEQSGSYVSAEKLRFDYSHLSPLKKEAIRDIEELVNQCVWDNIPVETRIMHKDEARQSGALAFFNEKYADTVRVLCIGNKSKEFCGGTHVRATGQIGLFKIISESSVAQGIRRIEAVTGTTAFARVQENEAVLENIASILKVPAPAAFDAAQKMAQQLKQQEKELQKLRSGSLLQNVDEMLARAEIINSVAFVRAEFENCDMNTLLKMSDAIREKKDPVICVLASIGAKNSILVVGLSRGLVEKGLDAVKIMKELTQIFGGSGGGRKELAQAGTKDVEKLRQALKLSADIVRKFL